MLKPLHDYVVLEKVKEEVKTASGIILTTKEAKDEPSLGEVVAVGPGKTEHATLLTKKQKPSESSTRSIPEQMLPMTRRIIC